MSTKILSCVNMANMLEENGVHISFLDEKVTSISVDDPHTDFSYSVTDGEIKELHFKDVGLEISYDDTKEETTLKIVHGRTVHTAIEG